MAKVAVARNLQVRLLPDLPNELVRCEVCGNLCNVPGIRPFVLRALSCAGCQDARRRAAPGLLAR